MAIALKLGSNGFLAEVVDDEALQADAFERKQISGDLIVGSTLSGGEELQLGSATSLIQLLGDSRVAGYLELVDTSAPANPDDGEGRLYKKTGDDGLFWKPDSAGEEIDLTSNPATQIVETGGPTTLTIGSIADGQKPIRISTTLIGAAFFSAESEAESTTTLSTPQQKLQLSTVTAVVAGKYKLSWDFTWRSTKTNKSAHFRVQQNDTTTLWDVEINPSASGVNQRVPASGTKVLDLTNAIHTFDLDYNDVDGGTTVGISQAHMTLEMVGA